MVTGGSDLVLDALFTGLVLAVAAQRLAELLISRRNEARLRALGGREHAPEQMPWMSALHASWLFAMIVEVWATPTSPPAWVSIAALAVFGIGQVLRAVAIETLGARWTVKVITLPGAPRIVRGPFAWLRHPNYLGVTIEMFALPIVGGAWITAAVATAANALLLWFRIRAEEAALAEAALLPDGAEAQR